jgi:hypothetical protein
MRAFRSFLGHSGMIADLAMMAPRPIELYRVLKGDKYQRIQISTIEELPAGKQVGLVA